MKSAGHTTVASILLVTAVAVATPPRGHIPGGSFRFDSLNCRMVGAWPFGPAFCVALDPARNLAFCGIGGGVYTLDISDPSTPELASSGVRVRGLVENVSYADSTLYCAAGDAGFDVWDVTAPNQPHLLSRQPAFSNVWDVKVRDTLAFVTDWNAGLRIYSVADPAHPVEVGRYDTPGAAYSVALYQDTVAVVADWEEGAQVIGVADPAHPQLLSNIPYGTCWGVSVDGDRAYLTDVFSTLIIVDISDPRSPDVLGGYTGVLTTDQVCARGDRVWLPEAFHGLTVLDVSNPRSPRSVGLLPSQGSCHDVVVLDTFAFVADWEGGIVVASVASDTPRELARVPTPDATIDAAKAGHYVYLASSTAGLHVIDVEDPGEPKEVGMLDTPGEAVAVYALDSTVYVADWLQGVRIVDVSDPTEPQEVGHFQTRLRCNDVEVFDTLAFASDDDSGLSIYSVADPANPYYVGGLTTGERVTNLAVKGDYVYIVDDDLRIVNITNPASPFEVGRYRTFDDARDVVVSGFDAFVVYEGGVVNRMRVIDVSNPSSPALRGQVTLAEFPWGLSTDGSFCYVSCLDSGVRIHDVSNPAQPDEVGYYINGSWALGSFAEDSYIYLANDFSGLLVLENELAVGLAARSGAGRATPAATVVRGVLSLQPTPDGPRQELLDALGRKVADLRASDNDVSRLAPGVYFICPASGVEREASSVTKVVIAK